MTLTFSEYHSDGTPTYFAAKIWKGLVESKQVSFDDYIEFQNYLWQEKSLDINFTNKAIDAKIHTIRRYRKGKRQWRVGDSIQYYMGNPRNGGYKFAPDQVVTNLSKIRIGHDTGKAKISIDDYAFPCSFHGFTVNKIKPDESNISHEMLLELCRNDGLTREQFWQWFPEEFEGTIIHWTTN